MNRAKLLTQAALALSALAAPIAAHAQTFTFLTSVGAQAPNQPGSITLTQVNANTVNVFVNLINTGQPSGQGYGFINTGGPHTPFTFQLLGSLSGISASFSSPGGGTYSSGQFSLSNAGGANTPYGTFNVAINSTAGNGSSNAWYGDLTFNVTRTGGLSTTDFTVNADGYYFAADLTNGQNTGAQAWGTRSIVTQSVPEPATVALLGFGVAGLALVRRKRTA